MSIYGALSSSMMAMMGHSQSMNTIAMNIANVNTGGYKSSETRFSTVLSDKLSTVSDLGGMRPTDHQRVDMQGLLTASPRDLDLAINGSGFFLLNTKVDGSGETFLTRDGSFTQTTGEDIQATDEFGNTFTTKASYLVDKNGYFVQGWDTDYLGNFTPGGATKSLRVDQYAFVERGAATTSASVILNIPAQSAVGDTHTYDIQIFDEAGKSQEALLNFTKTGVNTWDFNATYNSGATTSPVQSLTFDGKGALVTPTNANIAFAFTGGSSATVDFNLEGMTQFSGDFSPYSFSQNGLGASSMRSLGFDENGNVNGKFFDSTHRPLYRLALGVVSNPNALIMKNGNVFKESPESGGITLNYAKEQGIAQFSPFSLEMSNVDLADEFSKMIMTQNAYNSSATVFRTVDEMTVTAKDLKR
ncbi:MAG: flagellar hook-basal body complex protein [Rhodospirillaceae bacterium]|nr:flagellar hook-basal body complex protein [Rhodospirillaceae bacterium]